MGKNIKVGDLILLKDRFTGHGDKCIIIEIFTNHMTGSHGWTSFMYRAITNTGEIINLTESCIKNVIKDGRATGI